MRLALKRWPRVNDATSETGSVLAGSSCTLAFPQDSSHLFAGFQFADAVVTLNPETRGFCNDVVPWRKSHPRTGLFTLVAAPVEDSPMKNHHHAKQWSICRDHRGRCLRVLSEFF